MSYIRHLEKTNIYNMYSCKCGCVLDISNMQMILKEKNPNTPDEYYPDEYYYECPVCKIGFEVYDSEEL